MRPSPQRHTLAVLRNVIGITQKEMARILECSTATVQAVELGKLGLSQDLAYRIHFQTAASPEWLLANDVNQAPVTTEGKAYTKAVFEGRQATLLMPQKTSIGALSELWDLWTIFIKHVRLLAILYSEAYKQGKVPHAFYKSLRSTQEIFETTIGEDKSVEEKLKALSYRELGPVSLSELTAWFDEFEADTYEEFKRKVKQTKEPILPGLKHWLAIYEKNLKRVRKQSAKPGR